MSEDEVKIIQRTILISFIFGGICSVIFAELGASLGISIVSGIFSAVIAFIIMLIFVIKKWFTGDK